VTSSPAGGGARILDELTAVAGPREPVAAIHGTVDLERALAELGLPPSTVERAVADDILGARVVIVEREPGRTVAIAEPTTEGRLAAALARQGEGQVGEYVALPAFGSLDDVRQRAREIGIALSSPAAGPFGVGVLVLGGPIGGYQMIVVAPRSIPSAR
jgi:hypothetical protein